MTKQMKEGSTCFIELNKGKIDEIISSSEEYSSQDGNIFIKKWEANNEENNEFADKIDETKFISSIKKDGFQYSGSLNSKFQREGYGLEIFNNGDKYFGQFESNNRSEKGIYYFAPIKNVQNGKSEIIQTECYIGQWNNNLKNRNGIYIWMEQPENNFEYENANFDAYIGEFFEDKYVRGTYISKFNNDLYIYHGNFSKDGKKNDNNAYFFSSKWNKIFHGKIINDCLVNGFLGGFDEEGEIVTEIIYCKFNEDGSINDVIEQKQLEREDIEEEKKNITNFRNVAFDGDYFGKIYNRFTKIKIKIDKLEDMTVVLQNEENISEINKILNKYTKKNIYFDIEENFFGREI